MNQDNYKIIDQLSWRRIDNQVLILDSRINKKAHELNTIASFIWLEIDKGITTDHIINQLSTKYPNQSKESLVSDFHSFVDEMKNLGLLVKQ